MAKVRDIGESGSSLTRRGFLIATVGASAMFGFPSEGWAAMNPANPGGALSPATPPLMEPTLWYSIDEQGLVTVNIIRAEMGQHIGTAIARILADELEARWDDVRIVHVDTDPKWGLMVTGGSWSVWQSWPIYSHAGAAGRIALIEQAAILLGVSPSDCHARDSVVSSGAQTISYGDIVRRGKLDRRFTPDDLAGLPIKPASERRLVGQPTTALDIAPKLTGAARYGIDAKAPGMVYARPKIPPTRDGSKVKSLDDSAARKVKGYLQSLVLDDPSDTVPGWVMVIVESYPAAIRAADLAKVDWSPGPTAHVSENDILDHASQQIADPNGGAVLDTGGGDVVEAFDVAKATPRTDLHHVNRASFSTRAGECARVRERRAARSPYRQSMAELDPTDTRQGPESTRGAPRHAHLSDWRRVRPKTEWRLCRARRARRGGAWQAGEDGAHSRRRRPFRFRALALGPNLEDGLRRGGRSHGDGASRRGGMADTGHGADLDAKGAERRRL
jgi:hypothetical protein